MGLIKWFFEFLASLFGGKKMSPEDVRKAAQEKIENADIGRMKSVVEDYESRKKDAYTKLSECQSAIANLQNVIGKKERELNSKKEGDLNRRILSGEIARLKEELAQSEGVPAILLQNIGSYDKLIAKAKEAIHRIGTGDVEGAASIISEVLEEYLIISKGGVDALKELEKIANTPSLDEVIGADAKSDAETTAESQKQTESAPSVEAPKPERASAAEPPAGIDTSNERKAIEELVAERPLAERENI